MPQHYSTQDFFRRAPNSLLARYFQNQELFLDLDFTALKETKPDKLLDHWFDLPTVQRNTVETLFRQIFEMSCRNGLTAIIDEAEFHLGKDSEEHKRFTSSMAELPNHFHRILTVFLDHPEWWQGATRLYHADTLSYWRKRHHLGHQKAAVDDASLEQLATQLSDYFHLHEGRGKNCQVEPYRRGELDYFFAFPEDHSQHSLEWVNGEFANRPHNPAFEVVFVYSQKDESLDLNYRGSYKTITPLQTLFANIILKLDGLPPDPKDGRVYDLNPLRNTDFQFIYPPDSKIEAVTVKKLRLSSRKTQGERITLETDQTDQPDATYQLQEKIEQVYPLNLYSVTQVKINAKLKMEPGKEPKSVTFQLTHPNSCTLKYEPHDLILREMLADSGIELKEPPKGPDV